MTDKKRNDAVERLRTANERLDGWINAQTGYGIRGLDKTQEFQFNRDSRLQRDQLESLYIGNDLAATIIDRPIDDALRQGYELRFETDGSDPDLAKNIVDWGERTYQVTANVMLAERYARLFGGGAVVYGYDDGREWVEPPRAGTPIRFLRPVEKDLLWAHFWNADLADQDYGTVEIYNWQNLTYAPSIETDPVPVITPLHVQRAQIFQGVVATQRQLLRNKGWGDSVLRRVIDVLTKFDTAWGSIMILLQDASQGVYKVKGLMEILTSDNDSALEARFALIDAAKSVLKAIVLDADGEDYQRIATPLVEMSDVIEKAMLRVASAARMPVTVLFGDSPSGLNASGEGDLRNYYDMVRAHQKFVLGPAIEEIYTRLLDQPGSPTNGTVPENLTVVFPSLWQMSPTEEATLFQMQSQGDATNITSGLYTAPEATIHRSQASSQFGFPKFDIDSRVEILETLTSPEALLPTPAVEPDPEGENESPEAPPDDVPEDEDN